MPTSAWIVNVALFLALQQTASALPIGEYQPDDSERLQARYVIAGQPPPPCYNHICPLTTTSGVRQVVTAANSTVQSTATPEPSDTAPVASIGTANSTFPGTHQTAPVTCGDGTKPPCHNSDSDHGPKFNRPPTHQTAPVTCGDGTKPPCHGSASDCRTGLHRPPTHQTAPVTCGDGTKPPCHDSASGSEFDRPPTNQTTPITCGDGTKPPCHSEEKNGTHLQDCGGHVKPPFQCLSVNNGESNESKTRFPGTHQTAPITCGDGTEPPCGSAKNESTSTTTFPGTHQTAPITCGDGTKPPCHNSKPAQSDA